MVLIHVDCEGVDVLARTLRCFGAVEHESVASGEPITFYGPDASRQTFDNFLAWLGQWEHKGQIVVFVSDNPAYDWQMINYLFLLYYGDNPFGHSARRIGDFAAGLEGDFFARQKWKKLRRTKHTHHPVDDAMGNAEALHALMAKGRSRRGGGDG